MAEIERLVDLSDRARVQVTEISFALYVEGDPIKPGRASRRNGVLRAPVTLSASQISSPQAVLRFVMLAAILERLRELGAAYGGLATMRRTVGSPNTER